MDSLKDVINATYEAQPATWILEPNTLVEINRWQSRPTALFDARFGSDTPELVFRTAGGKRSPLGLRHATVRKAMDPVNHHIRKT